MNILVWQWGRFGAGPRTGADFAAGLNAIPGISARLSLSRQAEIMKGTDAPFNDMPVTTYGSARGYGLRVLGAPFDVTRISRWVRYTEADLALCAMPGPLDLLMHAALRHAGVPYAVVVHDADPHPGDGYPLQMQLQRALIRRADALVVLSDHVARRLREQGFGAKTMIRASLPQERIEGLSPVRAHGGPFRLLSFGRLLAYKGLDLLAAALAEVQAQRPMEVRVVGQGPEGPELNALRQLPGVRVENRWVPEEEVNTLLGWADGLVLSHREASQSGVAAAALAAGRYLVATRVGGLAEQAANSDAAIICEVNQASLRDALLAMQDLPPPAGPQAPAWDPAGLARALGTALLPGSHP